MTRTTSLAGLVALSLILSCSSYSIRRELPLHSEIKFEGLQELDDYVSSSNFDLKDIFGREFQSKPPIGFSTYQDTTVLEVLEDGQTSTLVEVTFRPEQGESFENYTFSWTANNSLVLTPADVSFISNSTETVGDSPPVTVVNMTIQLDFVNFPGVTNYVLEAQHTTLGTTFTSDPYVITVAGLVIYENEPLVDNIISGPDRSGYTRTYLDVVNNFVNSSFAPNLYAAVGWEDGCTSFSEACTQLHLDDLESINVTLSSGIIFNWDTVQQRTPACDFVSGTYDDAASTVILEENCPTALSAEFSDQHPYGIAFKPYKVGQSTISFEGDTENARLFTNFLVVRITDANGAIVAGPPVITAISPSGTFRADGGALLTVQGYNIPSNREYEFNLDTGTKFALVDGSWLNNATADTQTVLFTTASGQGQNLGWEFLVVGSALTSIDLTNPVYRFSYARPPVINSITPTQGAEGITLTLNGIFETFDSTAYPLVDTVLFEGLVIPGLVFQQFSDSVIVITVPPQPISQVYDVNLSVQIGTTAPVSNAEVFTYLVAPSIEVEVLLAEYNAGGDFYSFFTGDQDPAFVPTVSGNTNGLTYIWQLTLSGALIQTSTSAIFVPNQQLMQENAAHDVSLTVENDQGLSDSYATRLVKVPADTSGIGATLTQPPGRTRSTPSTPLKVSSTINLLGLPIANPTLDLAWEYLGQQYTEYNNSDSPSLRLLGRTFVVPNCFLVPGLADFTLRAQVQGTSIAAVSGTTVEISQANLIPKVNGGIVRESVNFNLDHALNALSSSDPDLLGACDCNGFTELAACQRQFLVYNWSSCIVSTDPNFGSDLQDCSDTLLAGNTESASFVLAEGQLRTVRRFIDVGGNVIFLTTYVRLGLTITSTKIQFGEDNRSSTTLYTMTLPQADATIRSPINIGFRNGFGKSIDPAVVKTWEPLVVSVEAAPGITWSYAVSRPVDQQDLLSQDGVLIEGDAFWLEGVQSQSLSLGLNGQRNTDPGGLVLSGPTQYSFLITDFRATATGDENNIEVLFETLETPVLEGVTIETTSGDENTIFIVSAKSSVQLADFVIVFGLEDVTDSRAPQERAVVSCLGECAGAPIVSFSVLVSGQYRLTAQLFDDNGNYLFDEVQIEQLVNVQTSLTVIETQNLWADRMQQCTALRDSGCLTYLNSAAAAVFPTSSRRSLVAGDALVHQATDMTATLSAMLNSISTRARQNSGSFDAKQTQSFVDQLVSATGNFLTSSYTSEFLRSNLEALLDVLTNQIDRDQGNLYMSALQNLFPRLESIALTTGGQGTGRRRLLQNGINVDLLDVQAVLTNVVPSALVQSQVCDSGVYRGSTTPTASSGIRPIEQSASKVCSAVRTELATSLTTFSACAAPSVSASNPKVPFLIETGNYPEQAGFSNVGNTDALANTGFTGFLGYNPSSTVQAGCYDVTLAYTTARTPDGADGYILQPQQQFPGIDCAADTCYRATTGNIESTALQTGIRRVNIGAIRVGLFSAEVIGGDAPLVPTPDAVTPTPGQEDRGGGGLSGGAIAGIIIGSLLGLILLILIAFIIFNRCCLTPGGTPDPQDDIFEYVERDVYGRGYIYETESTESTMSTSSRLIRSFMSSSRSLSSMTSSRRQRSSARGTPSAGGRMTPSAVAAAKASDLPDMMFTRYAK